MSVRSELEARVLTYANSQNPPIPVSYEGVPFTRPNGTFLQCFMLPSTTINPTVDASRRRTRGAMQVNVWVKDGKGSYLVDKIAEDIVNLFPVVPKTGITSIEQTPQTGQAITESDFRIVPVTIKYRVES